MATCSVDGCGLPHKARGWCLNHYRRWQRTGSVEYKRVRRTCEVDDCSRLVHGHGFCSRHYRRFQLYGDPTRSVYALGTPLDRLTARVEVQNDCWIWTGAVDSSGYGAIRLGDVTRNTHRLAYKLFVGDVPDGLELDHTCAVRRCVNPEHLEPVTHQENVARAFGRLRANG